MKEYFTTGQVAKMFPDKMKMTAKKVAQLFDNGELRGVRYSDGGRRRTIERRIAPESLAIFIARNKKVRFRLNKCLKALVAKARKSAGGKGQKHLSVWNRNKPRTCYYFAGSSKEPVWIQRTRLVAG